MSWNTDWPNAVSEVVTEIESLASAIQPILSATNANSTDSVSTSSIENQFLKLYAVGTVSGISSAVEISIQANGTTFAQIFTDNAGRFMVDLSLFLDGSRLFCTGDNTQGNPGIAFSDSTVAFSVTYTTTPSTKAIVLKSA
jgi:hypothetical protein